MSRPEHLAPPEIFYNEAEARKYTQCTRIVEIQDQLAERALELLHLPDDVPSYMLDLGCGSGLSGSALEDQGHVWVGMDISPAMLDVAIEREVEGDLILADMGQGCPFRAGMFDGALSISALQWLCNADKSSHRPVQRLQTFFSMLYACLNRTARAVLQFYPENSDQMDLITTQAMRAGFYGGVVVDYPNSSKAKKFFLVLMTGGNFRLPKGLGTDENRAPGITFMPRERPRQQRTTPLKNYREWIIEKKERRRRQGKEVRADSKYTARQRCGRL